MAEAETGWDFNPRFDGRCLDFNPVDLNGLLHDYETFLADASVKLGWGDAELWQKRATTRRELVDRYLGDETSGLYRDHDFTRGRHSPVAALSTVMPLFTGLASPAQG